MTHHVFVYGTLKKGQHNHDAYLSSSRFIGKATTSKDFLMFGGGFPLVRLPNKEDNHWFAGKVKGEVYEVNPDELKRLDRLEGHPHFYKRTITKIDEYPESEVWMYHWNDRKGRIKGQMCTPTVEKFGRDRIHDW